MRTIDDDDTVILEPNENDERLCILRRHNRLLSTLCGLHVYPDVVNAAVRVQTVTRGLLARQTVVRRRRHLCDSTRAFGALLAHARLRWTEWAIYTIQRYGRGYLFRQKTVLGRAISRVVMYANDLVEHELALLRMSHVCGHVIMERM